MSRFGKCQNLAGCLLAYRGEELEVAKDQPFICAECGKPLVEVTSPAAVWMRYVYALLAVVLLAGGAFAAFPKLRGLIVKHSDLRDHESGEDRPLPDQSPPENPTPTTSDTGNANPPPVDNTPVVTPLPADKPAFRTAFVRPTVVDQGETKEVKNEVLTRIDLMPNVSASDKDKLYNAVEKAHSMLKMLTISFNFGKTELSPTDIEALKTELERPEITTLRGNPTAVFVILGYADTKGDPKKSSAVSQKRADTVLQTMREKCDVRNMMHPVAMGGTKLLDADKLEKNRIVEIWAVLP